MKSKPISHYWRVFSAFLVLALLVGSVGYSPVKAQSSLQFEGILAYEDSTGNIILATGDGKRVPLTTDADANQNPLERNQKPTYKIFGFSPNGMYLAIKRWSDAEDEVLYIYDVAHGDFAAKLNFAEYRNDIIQGNQGGFHPMQWHQDSDSVIFNQSITEIIDEGTSYDHEYYYRVYFSGERVLLFDTYHNPNAMLINFDFNSVFELEGNSDSLYNWVDNTKYTFDYLLDYELFREGCMEGWSHDGLQFLRVDCEYGKITFIDTKNGKIIKTIDIPRPKYVHVSPWSRDISSREEYRKFPYLSLSPDSKHMLLTDDAAGLYDLNLETSAIEPIYTWPINNPENQINGLWSSSGNLIMVNTYYANSNVSFQNVDDQRVLIVKKGNLPVRVATNAEPLFWLSKDSERLVYAQYNVSGNQIDGDLMVYDHATGASAKIGDLPTFKDVDTSSGISYGYYGHRVDWTNGDDSGEVLPLPSDTNAAGLCPYNFISLFDKKQEQIYLLQDTSSITNDVLVKINFPKDVVVFVPPPFQELPKLNYDETEAQTLVDSIKQECLRYDHMSPEEKAEFDRKVQAFARLYYTEYSLSHILPHVVDISQEVSKTVSDLFIGLFSLLALVNKYGEWLSNGVPLLAPTVKTFLLTASKYLLDSIDKIANIVFGQNTNRTIATDIGKVVSDFFSKSWETVRDLLKDFSIDKWLAGEMVENFVQKTEPEIKIAVNSIPSFQNPTLPILEVRGTDEEAKSATVSLELKVANETKEAIEEIQVWNTGAEAFDMISDISDLGTMLALILTPTPAAPATVSAAAFLHQLSALMKLLSSTLKLNALVIGTTQYDRLTRYGTNSADIAFDPSNLTTVPAENNRIVKLDVASLNIMPTNYIPASAYYSRYQEQTNATVDEYKASIERLMQAIASGQDEQIRVVAEELLKVDEELRASLKMGEAPLIDMPYDYTEVQNLDSSIQDLRAQSFTLHVALATYMVHRTSPEIRQETQTIVADILASADNFKASYETMTQSGLAIPVKFLPVILDAKTPDAIVEGEAFSMTVKITNVGQISQQSPVTLSVSGGDNVEVPANQPLPNLAPTSQVEIPVNLKAKQDGNEFITVELTQDGNVIASKIVYLEIGKSNSIFSLLPTNYLIGGLGLLCLTVLAISGVFIYTRTRKPKHIPAKPVSRPQLSKPVSGSAEQIKRAIELSKAKRHQEAFEILRGIVQTEPNNMSAWFNLGGVLASMGNYKDAERCYLRAKQLGHPRGDDALRWLREHRK
ncbi:MAG: hypothetical protein HFACDABA_00991 [Anaerolineales bacterium]|nr:hypothetical protein [Anaerolineales bacterium]